MTGGVYSSLYLQIIRNVPNLDGECYFWLRVGLLSYDLGHGCVGGEMLGFFETVSCYSS